MLAPRAIANGESRSGGESGHGCVRPLCEHAYNGWRTETSLHPHLERCGAVRAPGTSGPSATYLAGARASKLAPTSGALRWAASSCVCPECSHCSGGLICTHRARMGSTPWPVMVVSALLLFFFRLYEPQLSVEPVPPPESAKAHERTFAHNGLSFSVWIEQHFASVSLALISSFRLPACSSARSQSQSRPTATTLFDGADHSAAVGHTAFSTASNDNSDGNSYANNSRGAGEGAREAAPHIGRRSPLPAAAAAVAGSAVTDGH